jgi:serine/threonine protein kinase
LFLVLEYVPHDLTGLLDVAYKFSEVEIKSVFQQLLEALRYMHDQKYVHRDIKSSNILIDRNFRLKLADFGLARSIEPPLLDNLHEYVLSILTTIYHTTSSPILHTLSLHTHTHIQHYLEFYDGSRMLYCACSTKSATQYSTAPATSRSLLDHNMAAAALPRLLLLRLLGNYVSSFYFFQFILHSHLLPPAFCFPFSYYYFLPSFFAVRLQPGQFAGIYKQGHHAVVSATGTLAGCYEIRICGRHLERGLHSGRTGPGPPAIHGKDRNGSAATHLRHGGNTQQQIVAGCQGSQALADGRRHPRWRRQP